MSRSDPVESFIEAQPEQIRNLLRESRAFLHTTAPGLREAMKWDHPTFMHDRNLFYLDVHRDHVVLGFMQGPPPSNDASSVFDDVEGGVAHVRVKSGDDLERPGLREAIRAAAGFRPAATA